MYNNEICNYIKYGCLLFRIHEKLKKKKNVNVKINIYRKKTYFDNILTDTPNETVIINYGDG